MVGHDEQPMALEVVARVDDDRQPIAEMSLKAVSEFCAADAARQSYNRTAAGAANACVGRLR
jgi:hypothetical protein